MGSEQDEGMMGETEVVKGLPGNAAAGEGAVAAALALAREALIAAHPDAVAELIAGATVEELRASVETARAAFARATERARELLRAEGSPAGAPARTLPVQVETMSAAAKIAAGLRTSRP